MASNHIDVQASNDWHEAFMMFNKERPSDDPRKVTLPIEVLGDLLRSCGQNPTLAEIREQEEAIGQPKFNFDTFKDILTRPGGFRDLGEPASYTAPFRVFDKEDTGYLEVGKFFYLMENIGEKMSREETQQILKDIPTQLNSDGVEVFKYEDVIKLVLNN